MSIICSSGLLCYTMLFSKRENGFKFYLKIWVFSICFLDSRSESGMTVVEVENDSKFGVWGNSKFEVGNDSKFGI